MSTISLQRVKKMRASKTGKLLGSSRYMYFLFICVWNPFRCVHAVELVHFKNTIMGSLSM